MTNIITKVKIEQSINDSTVQLTLQDGFPMLLDTQLAYALANQLAQAASIISRGYGYNTNIIDFGAD